MTDKKGKKQRSSKAQTADACIWNGLIRSNSPTVLTEIAMGVPPIPPKSDRISQKGQKTENTPQNNQTDHE